MRKMNKYYWFMGVSCASVLACNAINAFVLDLEYIGPEKRYELDRKCWERENNDFYMTYDQWIGEQDRRHESWLDWIGEGAATSLDWSYGNACGCNEGVNERGRD